MCSKLAVAWAAGPRGWLPTCKSYAYGWRPFKGVPASYALSRQALVASETWDIETPKGIEAGLKGPPGLLRRRNVSPLIGRNAKATRGAAHGNAGVASA